MKEAIRQKAYELGFDACGFTTADPPGSADRFHQWLREGRHGEMAYLARTEPRRVDLRQVLPEVASVVSLAVSYHADAEPPQDSASTPRGVVARYARGADYHALLGPPLKELERFLQEVGGAATATRQYVDTGPILERDLAQRAGVGFVGKHTGLIHRRLGNWLLLAEILTSLPLPPDPPETNRCGRCSLCLQACPTEAITAPFQLDARRCISYLTIELKGAIPEPLRPLIGNRIFGCDDCLAVCPWNRFARQGRLLSRGTRPDLGNPSLLELLSLDEAAFRARFRETPLARTKRRGLLRNVCVALGNCGDRECLGPLHRSAQDHEPLVAEHATWAIRRIEERHGLG